MHINDSDMCTLHMVDVYITYGRLTSVRRDWGNHAVMWQISPSRLVHDMKILVLIYKIDYILYLK